MKTTFPDGFEPTHEGTIYGIPIWWDARTFSLMGQNRFYDWLVPWVGLFHCEFATFTEIIFPSWQGHGFPLKLRPLPGFERMPLLANGSMTDAKIADNAVTNCPNCGAYRVVDGHGVILPCHSCGDRERDLAWPEKKV